MPVKGPTITFKFDVGQVVTVIEQDDKGLPLNVVIEELIYDDVGIKYKVDKNFGGDFAYYREEQLKA